MIVYLAPKSEFLADVESNQITDRIHESYKRTHLRGVGRSEMESWRNSMGFMHRILIDDAIPNDAGIAIEYGLSRGGKRIDFILTGTGDADRQTAIIVELKQWSEVEPTNKDAVVRTVVGGAKRELTHPSYQAWSYASLLEDFSEVIRARSVLLKPCAYLHNCSKSEVVRGSFYKEHVEKAPVFIQHDADKLKEFIKRFVKKGDAGKLIYQIRDGKLSPSKSLADCLVGLLQGNREFLMIDDQKIVYETALALAKKAETGKKQVLIVEGGPGTGKSVVAVNLLVELIGRGKLTHYVTKNAAPRKVFETKLIGSFKKSRIGNLFKGSGSYMDSVSNELDTLIVDEAHRLREKGGLFGNLGENQVKELINAARSSVFFLDESQRVTFDDIGSKEEIHRWAKSLGCEVTELALASQFRCNGSDGYLAWIDNTLQVRETANPTLEGIDYEFRVCRSASELRDLILERNKARNRARMVAGYCWDWKSKKTPTAMDIVFEEDGFRARWNLMSDGSLWIMNPDSVSEVGCIHTCQGLEVDYIGVIFGPDFLVRNGVVATDAGKRSRGDQTIKGYKGLVKTSPDEAKAKAGEIIKNTYRTLMSRAQRGCFVYSADPETNAYLQTAARGAPNPVSAATSVRYARLPHRLIPASEVVPFTNGVPIYDLEVAAGGFGYQEWPEQHDWVELPEHLTPREGYFVVRVVGESMNRRIPSGSWCLFKRQGGGSRNGAVVLVQHKEIQDTNYGANLTIKVYFSEKKAVDDSWEHTRIVLKPDSTLSSFEPIVLHPDSAAELTTLGEYVSTLGQAD